MKRKVGVFHTSDDAIAAIRRLQNLGLTPEEISVISHDETMSEFVGDERLATDHSTATTTGAVTGGLVGGLGALLIELGLIAIPGIGPFLAVGPVGAALVGALTGGAVGGLVGALVDMGFEEDEAKLYEEQIQQGKILVMVDDHIDRTEDLDAILNPGPKLVDADFDPVYTVDSEGHTTPETELEVEPQDYNNDPDRDELKADLGDDYLAATRRDHMGGGAPIDPSYNKFANDSDYDTAKQRDYMPIDRTEHSLDHWFKDKWHETKALLHRRWDRLTEADLVSIEDNRDVLKDKLRQHYGLSEAEVDAQLEEFFGPRDYLGDPEKEKIFDDYLRDHWDRAKGDIQGQWEELSGEHLERIRGDRGMLRETLVEVYGWTNEDAHQAIANYYSQRDFSDTALHKLEQDIESEDLEKK